MSSKGPTDLLAFNLGQLGLDLVTNPLATPPGTLLTAQNVEFIRRAGLEGLGSRGSLTPLNWDALDGPVLAMAPIPLASPADLVLPSVTIDPETLSVGADATDETADVTAVNTAWVAVSTVPWLVLTGTVSGNPNTSPTTIDFTVNAYTGSGSRVGKILVIGVGAMDTLTVTQSSADFLEIIPSLMPLGSDALTFPALVNASGAWTASVNQAWVTLDVTSGTAGVSAITVSVGAYGGGTFRTATLTVTNGVLSDTVVITQLADFPPMSFDEFPALPVPALDTPDGVLYAAADGPDTALMLLDDTGTPTQVATLSGRVVALTGDGTNAYIALVNDGFTVESGPVPVTGRVVKFTYSGQTTAVLGEEFGVDPGMIDNGAVDGGQGLGFAPSGLALLGGALYVLAGQTPPGTSTGAGVQGLSAVFSIDPLVGTSWVDSGPGGVPVSADNRLPSTVGTFGGFLYVSEYALAGADLGVAYADGVSPGDHPCIATSGTTDPTNPDDYGGGFGSGLTAPFTVPGAFAAPRDNPGVAWFGPFIEFNGSLFVAYGGAASAGGTAAQGVVYRLDTADAVDGWVEDHDVLGTHGGNVYPGQPYTLDGVLYWPWFGAPGTSHAGYLLTRTTGGVWTQVASDLDLDTSAASRVTV